MAVTRIGITKPLQASKFCGLPSAAQLSMPRWISYRCGGLTCRCLLRNKFVLIGAAVFAMTLMLLQGSLVTEAGDDYPVWRDQGTNARVMPISMDINGVRKESKMVNTSSAHSNNSESKPIKRATKLQPKSAKSPPKIAVADRRTPNLTEEINYFARTYMYNHSYPDGAEFVEHVARLIKRRWKQNQEKTETFKKDIRAALGTVGKSENIYLTKHNTPQGSIMVYYMAGKPSKLANNIWTTLPDNSVFWPNRFKVCNLIGSSGILNGSRCGKEIDQADFVFRFNIAPVQGFEMDVGTKTNFTTLNPTLIVSKINSIKTTVDEAKLVSVLRQFQGSHLFLPGFAESGSLRLQVKVAGVAQRANVIRPVYGRPDHFLQVTNLWRKTLNTGKKWPSTGLYALSSLFDACNQINVYGFWPFPKFITGKNVPYHYNNNIQHTQVHNFDKEFKTLLMLHEKGIINLHLESCQ